MTTRYQEKHYEDVARILLEFILLSHVSPMTSDLVDSFADLFAADNPGACTIPYVYHSHHVCQLAGGFNRARFLAACGIEG